MAVNFLHFAQIVIAGVATLILFIVVASRYLLGFFRRVINVQTELV